MECTEYDIWTWDEVCVKSEITSDCKNMTEKEYHQEKKKDKYVGGKEGNQLIAYDTRTRVMTL